MMLVPSSWTPESLVRLAARAMQAEAELTPKPGLVDRRGSGAHADMTLPTMLRSIAAIAPGLRSMAKAAWQQPLSRSLRDDLGRIGRETETAMLVATGGVNTHRGAIWALGLLVSAAAMLAKHPCVADIVRLVSQLAQLPDSGTQPRPSHGRDVEQIFGTPGARGEAMAGFPHVVQHGLATMKSSRAAGNSEACAQLDALLAIMAHLPDTCVLYRGGTCALALVQAGAVRVLAAGGMASAAGRSAMQELERQMLARGLSPGGSADLLCATVFLDALSSPATHVPLVLREAHRAAVAL